IGDRANEIGVGAAVIPRPRPQIRTAHAAASANAMTEHTLLPEQHRPVRDGFRIAGERIAGLFCRLWRGGLSAEWEREAADQSGDEYEQHPDVARAHGHTCLQLCRLPGLEPRV